MKKIKTFNVEEDVYKALLDMFKRHGVKNVSLSSFVNNCLLDLLAHLQEVEKAKLTSPESDVPMEFVISSMIKSLRNEKKVPTIWTEEGVESDPQENYNAVLLWKWETAYEADRLGVSAAMYLRLQTGNYTLSRNKQYLIEKETGKKFVVLPGLLDDGNLAEIREGEAAG